MGVSVAPPTPEPFRRFSVAIQKFALEERDMIGEGLQSELDVMDLLSNLDEHPVHRVRASR